jgi:hypothetical protein
MIIAEHAWYSKLKTPTPRPSDLVKLAGRMMNQQEILQSPHTHHGMRWNNTTKVRYLDGKMRYHVKVRVKV